MILISLNIYYENFLDTEDNIIKEFEIFEENINLILVKNLKILIKTNMNKLLNREFKKLKKIFCNLN